MDEARSIDHVWVVAVVWHGVLTATEVHDNYSAARRRVRDLKSSGYYDADDDILLIERRLNERDDAAQVMVARDLT